MKPETNTGRSHVDTAWMGVAGGLYEAPRGRKRGRVSGTPHRFRVVNEGKASEFQVDAIQPRAGVHPLESKNPRWPVRR